MAPQHLVLAYKAVHYLSRNSLDNRTQHTHNTRREHTRAVYPFGSLDWRHWTRRWQHRGDRGDGSRGFRKEVAVARELKKGPFGRVEEV